MPKRKTIGKKTPAKEVTFRASIPPMDTAIKIHGEGGARVQIDIAEEDLKDFLPALPLRQKVLLVTLKEAKRG